VSEPDLFESPIVAREARMIPSEAYELVCRVRRRLPYLVDLRTRGVAAVGRPETPDLVEDFEAGVRTIIERPHVYAWTADMMGVLADLVRAFPLDSHFAASDFLTPTGCWVFDTPLDPMTCQVPTDPVRPSLRMLSYASDAAGVVALPWYGNVPGTDGLPVPGEHPQFWLYEHSLSDAATSQSTRPDVQAWLTGQLRLFGAGVALLRQRLLVAERPELPRAERRRLARLDRDPSDLYVVRLRRTSTRAHDDEGRAIDWSCRWFVRGHWTQQPYGPRASLRRAQWIPTYVKGPEDKPLRVEAARVFAVDR
jgi:hypothetical protein